MHDSELCPGDMIALAEAMADGAAEIAKKFYRAEMNIDKKSDASPVTQADRDIETLMRQMITEKYPDHGIWGEEHGQDRIDAEWVWVLDPIDGTKAFMSGMPSFATLIGLLHRGKPVLGMIDQAITGDRWLGASGRSTLMNGLKISTRACKNLDRSFLKATAPDMFIGADAANFFRLSGMVGVTAYGGDAFNYGLLAAGFLDLVVEASMKPHDFIALVPVIEGAGGVITDWHGRALGLESDGRVLASGDKRLFETVRNIFVV
jgi:inositol-phosphate phosphatase/L-galactose 1-phosphate phosphatase/histidinol-phosphatase